MANAHANAAAHNTSALRAAASTVKMHLPV
jgi:hypothetical protein